MWQGLFVAWPHLGTCHAAIALPFGLSIHKGICCGARLAASAALCCAHLFPLEAHPKTMKEAGVIDK